MSISSLQIPRSAMALLLCSTIAVTAPVRQAKADHPVAVALIGAAATIISAEIAATAAVTVAVIGAVAVVVSSGDGGESSGEADGGDTRNEDGGDDSGDTGGGEESSVTIGEPSIPVEFQEILDRQITLSAKQGVNERRASGRLKYLMDGDIKRAVDGITSFSINDGARFRFEIAGVENAEDVPIRLQIEELSISTEDVPETRGRVRFTLTAMQDGKEIWNWGAQLAQGETANLRAPDQVKAAIATNEPNLLTIRDIDLPVPYTAPGLNGTTIVEVVLSVEGAGERF